MNIRKLEQIAEKIKALTPKRITVFVKKDSTILEVSVCECHRMLHNKEIQFDDIQGDWNSVFVHMGNCLADLEAWLHIMKYHTMGMHENLTREKGVDGISEYEAHEKLLHDMARKQTVKIK